MIPPPAFPPKADYLHLKNQIIGPMGQRQVVGMIPSEGREPRTEYRVQKIRSRSFFLCSLYSVLCTLFPEVMG
ncbi:MAG: hypothetical protein HY584_06245 [Candidatus Omnitrophica bacterium]|nr:hypothetical protein [Candidatus Omnitrophota bacterium]